MPTVILAGIGWHIIGAACAASFYAPIEKVRKWSWETTWAIAGFFSWILLPIGVSYLLLPSFHGFYASLDPALMLEGRPLRRHVGSRQCQLRAHHAPPGDVARHWRGHRRHAHRRHTGPAPDARPGSDALQHTQRPAHNGGRSGGRDRRSHRFLRRPSKRSRARRRCAGVQCEARPRAGRDVRDFFVGHVLRH